MYSNLREVAQGNKEPLLSATPIGARVRPMSVHGNGNGNGNGKGYGNLGKEYERLLIKAAADMETIRKLYDIPVFPQSMTYAAGGDLPDIFAAKGFKIRLFPVGIYTDVIGALEYYVLAAPNPVLELSTQLRVSSVHFEELHGFEGNMVALNAVLTLGIPATGYQFNHSHVGYCYLDENSKICGCKLMFQRLEIRDAPLPATQAEVVTNTIRPFCENFMNYAAQVPSLAAEDRYASVDDCVAFNTAPVRYRGGLGMGYAYVDQDSPKCRTFHLGLVSQNLFRYQNAAADNDQVHADLFMERARVHLTHAGPLGGGKCVDHPFESFFHEDFRCSA